MPVWEIVRNARDPPPQRPYVGTGRAFAEIERALDDAQVGINLERSHLHAQRSRLQRWPGVPVDDLHAHASPNELIRVHQTGRARSDDEDVNIHMGM
jgi:hypothetical protein